ncbi:PEP-CTERM sorting domain-containing protein [Armatimonas sp.]|uniref:PEP-CTERM sorting domain-containing protein n=1 Tax=Armatimonas sp. TaxID=1872638 RepID=UPI00286AF3F6|nr:PEP-CTERM sorting domain-containing protein [Armatimonas sp.]
MKYHALPFPLGLALALTLLAPAAFAQSSTNLFFDLSSFTGQSSANLNSTSGGLLSGLTFQAFNGTQMATVKGGAGLLKTQYGQSGQTAFDLNRSDWFYTLCVEPTAWLTNGASNDISTTKGFMQPWASTPDPKANDTLALLYHNYANRNPADPSSPRVANTLGEQAGLQLAFWEIVNDFDSSKANFGLDLSQGLFNFKLNYTDGSVNRQELIDSANSYLTYTKDTLKSGKDISGYQAQYFQVNNTVDSKGNLRGQDVVGGQSIPEPGTLALALLGLLPLAARRRNARR